jgi:uncharacterized protein (TIGR02996 family)
VISVHGSFEFLLTLSHEVDIDLGISPMVQYHLGIPSKGAFVITSDELALIEGIRNSDFNDTLPRLVYADWLEEHDQHQQADFIRMSCQLFLDPHNRAKSNQVRHVKMQWLEELSEIDERLATCIEFHHGLPHAMDLSTQDAFEIFGEINDWDDSDDAFPNFLDAMRFEEGLARNAPSLFTRLLFDAPHEEMWTEVIPDSQALAGFHGLLFHRVSNEEQLMNWEPLVRKPWFNQLKELFVIGHGPSLTEEMISGAAVSEWMRRYESFENLERLTISGLAIRASLREPTIIGQKLTPNLKQLQLIQVGNFDSDFVRLVPRIPASLRELDLSRNRITNLSIEALGGFRGKLSHLILEGTTVGDAGVNALCQAEPFQELNTLSLNYSGLTDVGLQALMEASFVESLVSLDLGNNHLTRTMLEKFLKQMPFTNLQRIALKGNDFDPDRSRKLRKIAAERQIQIIDL